MDTLICIFKFFLWFLSAVFPAYVITIFIFNPTGEIFYQLGVISLFLSNLGLFLATLVHEG
jgi:hypothetical protein